MNLRRRKGKGGLGGPAAGLPVSKGRQIGFARQRKPSLWASRRKVGFDEPHLSFLARVRLGWHVVMGSVTWEAYPTWEALCRGAAGPVGHVVLLSSGSVRSPGGSVMPAHPGRFPWEPNMESPPVMPFKGLPPHSAYTKTGAADGEERVSEAYAGHGDFQKPDPGKQLSSAPDTRSYQ